ncbi:uncharacterized protein [Rutidosis leptorrhynchoides]|uniref:uncharacterized protein n=1 Tax=Rutidosis leptorrhynchoides TaxID=125765 RepID=UPI003A9A334E
MYKWVNYIPRKINIFLWRLALDRLPTRQNLSRRGVVLKRLVVRLATFVLNRFIDCILATELWRKTRIWIDMHIPQFMDWAELISWLDGWRASEESKTKVYTIFTSAVWHLWWYMNSVIFRGEELKKALLFESICCVSFFWIQSRAKFDVNLNLRLSKSL